MCIHNRQSAIRNLLGIVLLAVEWGRFAAADPPQAPPPWWDPAWKYCQTVNMHTPPLASGINTVAAEIDPMGKAQPDGRDVRVVTSQKAVLPCQIVKGEGGTLKILFQLPPDNTDTFYVYYGNPSAPPATGSTSGGWEKRLGGLTMETRALIQQRWVSTWDQVQAMMSAHTQVFGSGPRPCINDSRNPYSSQQEHFLAIYRGKIFCPEPGRYSFATNSDDASFLLIDGNMVVQWPMAHDASIDFYEHHGEVSLSKGIHSIEYYLVQLVGAARSFAGWKKPTDKEYSMIPPEAFVQTLLARGTAFQEHLKSVSPYFTAEIGRQIRFNKSDRVFTQVAFRDCSTTLNKGLKSWRWDFGDGATCLHDPNPVHEYTEAGEYKVSLEVQDDLGFKQEITRTVKIAAKDPQRVTIFFDTDPDDNVLLAEEPLKVTLRFGSTYAYPLPLALKSTVKLDGNRDVQDETNEMVLEPGVRQAEEKRVAWRNVKKEFPSRPGVNTITFRLQYLGVTIAESGVRILPTNIRKGSLAVFNDSLLDSAGNVVALRLTEPGGQPIPAEATPPDLSKKIAGEGPCKIVVVEDCLSPPEGKGVGKTFRDLLQEKLSAAYPGRRFEIMRAGELDQSAVYPPLERLARVESDVVAAQPDIVIWLCSLSDILNYIPIESFNRYLKASMEMIRAQTKADILLVSCPPVVVNPEIGHSYAFAMKKVALRYNIPSVDLFSVFCRMGDNWRSFFRDELNRGDPVFCLYPNSAGQELIAGEIFERLVE